MEPLKRGEIPTPPQLSAHVSELVGTFQSLQHLQHDSTYNPTVGRFVHIRRELGTGEHTAAAAAAAVAVTPAKAAKAEAAQKKLAASEAKRLFADIQTISGRILPLAGLMQDPTLIKQMDLKDVALLSSKMLLLTKAIDEAESKIEDLSQKFPGQEEKVKEQLRQFISQAKSEVKAAQNLLSTSARIKVQGAINDLSIYGPSSETLALKESFEAKKAKVRKMLEIYKYRMDLKHRGLDTCHRDLKLFNDLMEGMKAKDQGACIAHLQAHQGELKELQTLKDTTIASLSSQIEQVKQEILAEEKRIMPEIEVLRSQLKQFMEKSEELRSLDSRLTAARRRGDKSEIGKLEAELAQNKGKERLELYKQWINEHKQKIDLLTMQSTSPMLAALDEKRIMLENALVKEQESQGLLLRRLQINHDLEGLIRHDKFRDARNYIIEVKPHIDEAIRTHEEGLAHAMRAFEFYAQLASLTNTIDARISEWTAMFSGKTLKELDYGTILAIIQARDFLMNPVPEI